MVVALSAAGPLVQAGAGALGTASAIGAYNLFSQFLKQKAYEYVRDNDIPTIAGHVGAVAGTGRRAIEYFSGNRTAYGPNVTVVPASDTLRIVSPPSYSALRPGLSAAYYAPSYRRPPRYRRRRFLRGRGLRRYYRLRRRGQTAGAYFVRKNFW